MTIQEVNYVKEYLFEGDINETCILNIESLDMYNNIVKAIKELNINIVRLSSFCLNDNVSPNMENFYNALEHINQPTAVIGISQFFKFIGKDRLKNEISVALSKTLKNKALFITFQCFDVLKEILSQDIRLHNRITILGEKSIDNFCFDFIKVDVNQSNEIRGFKNLLAKMEDNLSKDTYRCFTTIDDRIFKEHCYAINIINNYYDVIAKFDKTIKLYSDAEFMSQEQWGNLYKIVKKYDCLDSAYNKLIGRTDRYKCYESIINDSRLTNIYILALRADGSTHYLNYVAKSIKNVNDFLKGVYLSFIVPVKSENFNIYYLERKKLCNVFNSGRTAGFINDYCKFAVNKGIVGLKYLTDNTENERKAVIEIIDKEYFKDISELIKSVSEVYPDLAAYLSCYYFNINSGLLDEYFKEYKFCKVVNKISHKMEELVREQSIKRGYNYLLPTRTEVLESIKGANDYVIFTDAMGVEYLSFILKKSKDYQMNVNIQVARANLPTLTDKNKDFEYEYNYKELDKLKHHPEGDYNYEKTKLPIHIVKELNLVDELLKTALDKLSTKSRVLLVSDHGASRLAVIANSQVINSGSQGEHNGRCCNAIGVTNMPNSAVEEGGYYCMANYDRFKGGRASEVEVHGGATLEEVVVPIIVLTRELIQINVKLINTLIKVSFKQKAILGIETSIKLQNPYVIINGKKYNAENNNEKLAEFILDDIKKPGDYIAKLYDGGNQIGDELNFIIESKVSSENTLF